MAPEEKDSYRLDPKMEELLRYIAANLDGNLSVDALAGRFFALQLRDDTTVRREVWDRCGEDTLRGLFLQELRREYDGADEETRRRIELAARFGVAAMDNREV